MIAISLRSPAKWIEFYLFYFFEKVHFFWPHPKQVIYRLRSSWISIKKQKMTIKKINLARLAHLQPIFIFLLLTAINADPAPGVSTKKLPIEAFLPENVKKAENLPNTPKSQNQGNGVEREADAKFEKEWEKASHLGATSLRDTAQIGLPNGTLGVFDYRLSSRGKTCFFEDSSIV